MMDKIEGLIKSVYRGWRSSRARQQGAHPDEEALACFLEGRLGPDEAAEIKQHLISCRHCSEAFSLNLNLDPAEEKEVPPQLIAKVKDMLAVQDKTSLLEIFLRFKERSIEIINTTGDVLFGQELVPASILRSRRIKDLKDEVMILKDFKGIRVEARIENKLGRAFNLGVCVKQKTTQRALRNLRITLIKDDLELESYLSGSGSVTFEDVLPGRYKLEISGIESSLATIILDIKV